MEGPFVTRSPWSFLLIVSEASCLKTPCAGWPTSQDNSLERKIFTRCKGAVMFGCPNLGMEQNHLLATVRGNSTERLVRDLSRESGAYGYLHRLELSFSGIAETGHMKFFWVFETNKSPTFDPGTSKMTGPSAILVDPDSATAHRVNESPSSVHPIARNHSELVKFTRTDSNTGPVIDLMRRLCGLTDINSKDDDAKVHFDAVAWLTLGAKPNDPMEDETVEERRQRLFEGQHPHSAKPVCILTLPELLHSLDTVDLDLRQALIADRLEHTCEWIYEHKPFTLWLKQADGVFWIHGKPGSGKSTLMKLICTDKRTRQHSHTFGSSVHPISAEFFFNYRGTPIQKTLEGLMRSILRQTMRQLSKIRATIDLLDILLEELAENRDLRGDPWPISRLEEFLRSIMEQKRVKLQITFFFDALDEFDGPTDYISRFVKYLACPPAGSLTSTKVCFSSRPWDDFVTNFSNGPSLAVEDFTKEDIRYFCTTKLSTALKTNHLDVIVQLPDEIAFRASGVFLWASLILKELEVAFAGAEPPSLEDVLQLLNTVPTELLDYYAFIIQRIPRSCRWKTYALLESVVSPDAG